jgi:hypothetical protein
MFFGGVETSERAMESELELILVTMRKVEELTANIDQIQLNKQLCNYLGKRFTKKRAVLERAFASMSTLATMDQKKVLQEIHMVAKCGEALVQKCLCKEFSWLDGAITLANVERDVIEILLGLSWWTRVLNMSNADMVQSEVIQKALTKQEKLFQKFLNADNTLQGQAKVDNDYLCAKLKVVKGQHANADTYNKEQILSIYLLARIMGNAGNVPQEVDVQLKVYTKGKSLGKGGFWCCEQGDMVGEKMCFENHECS